LNQQALRGPGPVTRLTLALLVWGAQAWAIQPVRAGLLRYVTHPGVPLTVPISDAAFHSTDHFRVRASDETTAKKVGEEAERIWKEKNELWFGKVPDWNLKEKVTIDVASGFGSGSGATTFDFGKGTDKPGLKGATMEVRGGSLKAVRNLVAHEVTHLVMANHFQKPLPRWADEGIAVFSETAEEQFSQDVRCRELLNAGRGIRLDALFRMTEYPRDMLTLYAQGHSVVQYLMKKGGEKANEKLVEFIRQGMDGNSNESWAAAAKKQYGFGTLDAMQEAWIEFLRTPAAQPKGCVVPEDRGLKDYPDHLR
jgi:hypothetical protein